MFKNSKHKTLFRVGIVYLAVSWLIVQTLATLTPILDLPPILVSGFAFMLIGAYPFIMMLVLAYQMVHKSNGQKRHNEPARQGPENTSGITFNIFVFCLVGLSIAILLLDIFVLRTIEQTDSGPQDIGAVITSTPVLASNSNKRGIVESLYEKSIAVLPFVDLSENSDQEYFSDGLSQDLIYRLSMMSDLQVAGRESSFYYKGRNQSLSDMGESLHVANILLGSVHKSSDQLSVTAQLVSAATGNNIWSFTYNGELADMFAIQNEIIEAVVAALGVTVAVGDIDVPGMTDNIEAYDKSLQAQALFKEFTPDSVLRAINLLEEAVKSDPHFGRGWLMLGSSYDESQLILSRSEAVDFPLQAVRAFTKAGEIAPTMSELLLVNAGNLRNQGRFLEAEKIYLQYVEHYGYSVAHAMEEYARLLARTGQFNEAIAMLTHALRTDPLDPRYTYQLALLEMYRGKVEEVKTLAESGLDLDGGDFLFRSIDWELAMREGDMVDAVELIRQYYKVNPDETDDAMVSARFMEKLSAILERNEFQHSTDDIIAMINDPSVTPLELGYLAKLVAIMGQPAIALDYWFGEMASPAIWDKVYDDMRRLPDFNQLVQEKGLVDYWRATDNWGDFCVAAGGYDFVCK